MATKVRELMTPDPVLMGSSDTANLAAQRMRDQDIGDVLIQEDGTLKGIVTDRDLVVRILADGTDGDEVSLGQICSSELSTVGPDDDVAEVIERLRHAAVRRVPVVEDGAAVGILALGDLARARDPKSALADISAAPGNA